mgnify:CR=1 FL=1
MGRRMFRPPVPRSLGLPLLCGLWLSCAGPAPDARREHVYIPRGASLLAVPDTLAMFALAA